MLANKTNFTSKDITTIYDALLQCSGHEVAQALVGERGHASNASSSRARMARLAERRTASFLRLLSGIEPDYEASARIILPWKASHLAALSAMSWPDALGTRIVFPSNVTPSRKARLLANVLLGMSYV